MLHVAAPGRAYKRDDKRFALFGVYRLQHLLYLFKKAYEIICS
jgi:hypothetical protein